jgi:hypothetical protein
MILNWTQDCSDNAYVIVGLWYTRNKKVIVLLERCMMIVLMNEYKQIAKLNNFSIKSYQKRAFGVLERWSEMLKEDSRGCNLVDLWFWWCGNGGGLCNVKMPKDGGMILFSVVSSNKDRVRFFYLILSF